MNAGVYKVENPKGRVYIGSSLDVKKRISNYRKGWAGKGQPRLYSSFIKYGTDNHIFTILEFCEELQIKDRERYWQEYYEVLSEAGLNCVLVESEGIPKQHTQETKDKIRNTLTGRTTGPRTQETKDRISTGRKKSWQSREDIYEAGKTVSSVEELQAVLSVSFPTLKRRMVEYGLHDELKKYWKQKKIQNMLELIDVYSYSATNAEHLAELISGEKPVGVQVVRRIIKQYNKQDEIYVRMSNNKLKI
jgi:group I intron endonuclease